MELWSHIVSVFTLISFTGLESGLSSRSRMITLFPDLGLGNNLLYFEIPKYIRRKSNFSS